MWCVAQRRRQLDWRSDSSVCHIMGACVFPSHRIRQLDNCRVITGISAQGAASEAKFKASKHSLQVHDSMA